MVRGLAHSNICTLIRLRGDRMAAPANAQVDVIVHGTNARGEPWAQADSSFARRVRRERAAVTASFQWSGGMTEMERQQAGDQLAVFLGDLRKALKKTVEHDVLLAGIETLPAVCGRDINVIAHSHGGNVLGHAMAQRELEIGIAMLLAVPALANASNANLSWTAEAANRVVRAIVNVSDRRDPVQTTLAGWNERIRGRRVESGRHFHRPESTTDQSNWMLVPASDQVAIARAERRSRPAGASGLDGADYFSLLKDALLRLVNPHSAMHSDRIGSDIGKALRHITHSAEPVAIPGWLPAERGTAAR